MLFAWQRGPALLSRVRLLHWQRQCCAFSEAPGTVAYEEQRLTLDPEPAGGSDEILHLASTHFPVGRTPGPMARLLRGTRGSFTVFLHARSAGGARRLVVVTVLGRTIDPQVFHSPGGALCVAHVYSLASFRQDVTTRSTRHFALYPLPLTPLGKLKLYAAQPDASDESHFTIDYETHERRGTIDGWLMPDDTVKLELRH